MTQIPDAAVQAAENAVYKRHEKGFLLKPLIDRVDMRKALTAALPHLTLGYEVKKLEWVENGRWGHLFSEGTYEIAIGNPYCALYILGKMAVRVEKERINDLKAAAQADFERRVRECHEPRPDIKTIIDEISAGTRQGFLNEGDQPEASDAELSCPHCGGSGHIDDVATKPVDVAAVRRQALDEAASWLIDLAEKAREMEKRLHAKQHDGKYGNRKKQHFYEEKKHFKRLSIGYYKSARVIRSLSAEPVVKGQQHDK